MNKINISHNKIIALSLIVFVVFGSILTIQQYAFASGCYVEDFYFNWFQQDVFNQCIDSSSGTPVSLNDLTDVTLVSISNNQIMVYNSTSGQWENENQTTFSDTTVCNNLGSGKILCASGNVNIKSLLAGTGITLTNDTNTVTITNSLPESTVCANLGSVGEGIYVSGNCDFKKLLAGNGMSLSSNGTRITITNTLPEATTGSNLYLEYTAGSSLTPDTGITLSRSSDGFTNAGEFIDTNSRLANVQISTIIVAMQKIGSPTGTITVGVCGATAGTFTQTFGTKLASTVSASPTAYTFTIYPSIYTLVAGTDRLCVNYSSGDPTNNIVLLGSTTDKFDGSNTYSQRAVTTTWANNISDIYFLALGKTFGVFKQLSGNDLQFKTLVGSSDIRISNGSDYISIDYNGTLVSDDTTCTNVGTGSNVYKDGECNFRSIIGSNGITATQNTNDITLTPKWELLCTTTLGSASNDMSCGAFTARKNLYVSVELRITSSGTAYTPVIRFNSDSGNNYAYRYSANGGADTTATSTSGLQTGLASNANGANQFTCTINNNTAGDRKSIYCFGVNGLDSTVATLPGRSEMAGKWGDTSNQITTISIIRSAGTTQLNTGSTMTVWGYD